MLSRLDDFVDQEPLDAEAAADDPYLAFLPPHIMQQGIYKLFYIAYRSAFHAIRTLLSISEAAPTASNLRTHLAEGAREGRYSYAAYEFFLERGGSVKYALDYVIHKALWTSPTPLGDGSFDHNWDSALPFPDPRPAAPPRSERVMNPSNVLHANSPNSSPKAVPSPFRMNALSASVPDANPSFLQAPKPAIRRRSNSFKEVLFGKKERMSWLLQIKEDDHLNHELKWKLKDEWDTSGKPGCVLDNNFRGIRYLMGLHTAPRWEVDDADWAVIAQKKTACELKRVSGRFD